MGVHQFSAALRNCSTWMVLQFVFFNVYFVWKVSKRVLFSVWFSWGYIEMFMCWHFYRFYANGPYWAHAWNYWQTYTHRRHRRHRRQVAKCSCKFMAINFLATNTSFWYFVRFVLSAANSLSLKEIHIFHEMSARFENRLCSTVMLNFYTSSP